MFTGGANVYKKREGDINKDEDEEENVGIINQNLRPVNFGAYFFIYLIDIVETTSCNSSCLLLNLDSSIETKLLSGRYI